jgi:hypothetical protein
MSVTLSRLITNQGAREVLRGVLRGVSRIFQNIDVIQYIVLIKRRKETHVEPHYDIFRELLI